jgi:hypothetical protein
MDTLSTETCAHVGSNTQASAEAQPPQRPSSSGDPQSGPDCLRPSAVAGCQEMDEYLRTISKEQRGWRKLIRNFTPSYVITGPAQSAEKPFAASVIIVCCSFSDIFTDIGFIRWFSVTMGTGIVSILLHNLPYNGIWLYWLSVIIFALNVFLFCLFLIISILRYTIYPQIWSAMIRHPSQSLFLGTFPMGLATIVNMIVFVCVPAWGTWTIYLVRLFIYPAVPC